MRLPEYNQESQLALKSLYPHQPLKGQIALVTGGSSGIGEGCARHLAAAGASVAINFMSHRQKADLIAAQITGAGGEAFSIGADVSQEPEVLEMFDQVRSHFGTLDILVSNAGLQKDAAFVDMTVDQWDTVMNVNLRGMFLNCREAVREFQRRDRRHLSKSNGKIICMSSVHEVIPWAGHINYAASKGGVMLLMKSLAQEVSKLGIRVNSIAPGAIATPINKPAWETQEALDELMAYIPYDRIGTTDDIGQAAVWLSSDASDYVVGTTLFVDGGMTTLENFSEGG